MATINILWRLLRIPGVEKQYQVFHQVCCYIFNLRCTKIGDVSGQRPTLFLVNHVSYLDIFVLGRFIPAYFIAKSEVAGWPILGWLAKLQNTLFFERNSKKVRGQLTIMSEHFNNKGNLILFPEGTSTEGEHVEPFKSSLLQAVEGADSEVLIQPVCLVYKNYQNQLMDRSTRDQYAWYAAMPFASHFFNVMGLGIADVDVVFHEPVKLNDFLSRKECAQFCHQQVSESLSHGLIRSDSQ